MKDIFGSSVRPGSVICYPVMSSVSKQRLNFAVVLKTDDINKRGHSILARALDTDSLKGRTYQFRREFNVDQSKVWVLNDLSILPPDMVKKLTEGFEFYQASEKSKAIKQEKLAKERSLGASERHRRDIKAMGLTDSLFQQMQDDVMNI